MSLVGKWPAQEGEVERLRGGFGGVLGWSALVLSLLLGTPAAVIALAGFVAGEGGAGLCCGSFALLAAFCGLWPLLRSSTYVLTNRRLIVTPRFGSTVAIPLSGLDRGRITVEPLTCSLTLHGERPIALRFIRRHRQLWGLLLVPVAEEVVGAEIVPETISPFAPGTEIVMGGDSVPAQHTEDSPLAPRAPPAPVDFVWWQALRLDGLTARKGIAILRPDYFAFFPIADAQQLVGETAGVVVGIAADMVATAIAGAPFGQIRVENKVPFEALLSHLSQCDAASFDDEIDRIVEEFDGLMWRHGDAVVDRKTKYIPLQGRHVANVHNRTTHIAGDVPTHQLADFHRLAERWPEIPDCEYRSTSSIVFLFVLLLFFSLLSGYSIYRTNEDPILLAIGATSLVTIATLVGWFGWFRMLAKPKANASSADQKDLRRINEPRFDR
jgi:hypothetical protein